ncbi:MAG TPA: archease [Caldisericia bacterium]|nr:archease [Caldisericia bacterium]HOR47282.1 archease [Caldisericia bacterium]HOU07636.1 archease [Caldisericia bacterium]HPL88953.1 archease [Caldisericia bacterium]HQG59460.1 archease [Caldisericia bacterium]
MWKRSWQNLKNQDWFKPFDHTADLGACLNADSLEGLVRQGALALLFFTIDPATVEANQEKSFEVEFDSPEQLLVRTLSKLVYLVDCEGFLTRNMELKISGNSALVKIYGEIYNKNRHQTKHLIKAVTWGGLEVKVEDGKYLATVIFDD